MTRTERSLSLRALAKDRSEARNGMDSSVPKGGAGAHNWGSLDAEFTLESDANADGDEELEDQAGGKRLFSDVHLHPRSNTVATSPSIFFPAATKLQAKEPAVVRRTSSVTDEDRENAMKVRKNAFKINGSTFSYETFPLSVPLMTPL